MKSRNKGIIKAMTMFAALIIMVTGLYGCGTGAAGTSDEDKKASFFHIFAILMIRLEMS